MFDDNTARERATTPRAHFLLHCISANGGPQRIPYAVSSTPNNVIIPITCPACTPYTFSLPPAPYYLSTTSTPESQQAKNSDHCCTIESSFPSLLSSSSACSCSVATSPTRTPDEKRHLEPEQEPRITLSALRRRPRYSHCHQAGLWP